MKKQLVRAMADIGAGLLQRLQRLACNHSGVGAVEFALIFPVMITMYFATIEISDKTVVARRVIGVAQTSADLVAQVTSVSNADLTNIFNASTAILAPYPAASVKITITSLIADSSNIAKVAWSSSYNGTARTTNSTVTLPSGLTTAGTSIIMAEVTYTYTPPLGKFLTGNSTFTDTAYLRPRRSVSVAKTS